MLPPQVGPGFSGLQTRDHQHLVRTFGEVRSALPRLTITQGYKDFVAEVSELYDAHGYVCARFGGDRLPSLRMAAATNGRTDRSGVEVVREMAARRTALLEEH
jgi:hypothetical protein